MSDLIAVGFQGEHTADQVLNTLQALQKEYLIDLADACVFLMRNYESPEIVNVGCGEDVSIRELAELVRDVVGYSGDIVFDTSKPDGTPQRVLDVSKLHSAGWSAKIGLKDGIATTVDWYRSRLQEHLDVR